jgi:hypothetical protein
MRAHNDVLAARCIKEGKLAGSDARARAVNHLWIALAGRWIVRARFENASIETNYPEA